MYVLFREFRVLIHCDVCGEAIVCVSVGSEPVRSVAKYSLRVRRLGSNGCEDRRPSLDDAVHEDNWAIICRVVWVGLLGLYMSFVVLMHHFLCVAAFCHYLEKLEDEIMGRVG